MMSESDVVLQLLDVFPHPWVVNIVPTVEDLLPNRVPTRPVLDPCVRCEYKRSDGISCSALWDLRPAGIKTCLDE